MPVWLILPFAVTPWIYFVTLMSTHSRIAVITSLAFYTLSLAKRLNCLFHVGTRGD